MIKEIASILFTKYYSSMNYEQLKLANQLCHRFYIASNSFTRAYRDVLEPLDLTYPQYVVMMALWEKDRILIGELINATHIDGGSLSLILKKLVTKKLIKIQSAEKDQRQKIIVLTASGKQLKRKAIHIPEFIGCKLPSLNDKEIKALSKLLDKLNKDFLVSEL